MLECDIGFTLKLIQNSVADKPAHASNEEQFAIVA
jgi:hypothetical protein